jgi:hypothetical protein
VRGLRRLLRPLVRLLLRHQVTYPHLANLLKSVYVELADQDFGIPGKPQTISRTSLLTGIHRKDVKRLREEPPDDDSAPATVSLGAQLVLRWTAAPEYRGVDGRPLALPRLSGDDGPSFDSLVASVSKDIRPRAVLDEWLRLGIATLDAQDRVSLVVDAFVPESGFDAKAYYFGRNLHDHIAAAAHNLSGDGPPLLERSVYYGGLTPEAVDELATLSERTGMEALQAVNRRALALQEQAKGRSDADRRLNFGVYFFRARVEDPGDGPDVD